MKLKKNVIKFIESLNDKPNKAYFDYLSEVRVLPDKRLNVKVSVPDGSGKFVDVPLSFSCPVKILLKFQGLITDSAFIEIKFPERLIGEKFVLPTAAVSIETYRPWRGNIGLAWDPTFGGKKFGFYPYSSIDTIQQDIDGYARENIVDPLCDFLNNYDIKCANTLRKNIAKFLSDKKARQFWEYTSAYNKKLKNTLRYPIRVEYDEMTDKSRVYFEYFGVGDLWYPPAEAILNFLVPISESSAYFNDEGELLSPEELEEIAKKQEEMRKKGKAKDEKIKSVKVKKKEEKIWDPFAQVEQVKRDEFGFIIDDKKAEFTVQEFDVLRNKLREAQKQHMKEILKKELTELPPEPQDVSRWSGPSAWFNEMAGKKFTITGGTQELSFKEKGELNMLKSCNPPFILKFARDEIRLKYKMIGSEVVKLMFKYYKKGFLRPVA